MNGSTTCGFQRSDAGFSLIELLISITIIAVLAALVQTGASKAIDMARTTQCASQMKQIGQALQLYAIDNGNCYPAITDKTTNVNWDRGAIAPYLANRPDGRQNLMFVCPATTYQGFPRSDISVSYGSAETRLGIDPSTGNVAFTYGFPRNLNSITNPASSPLLFDACQSGALRYSSVVTLWNQLVSSSDIKATATTSAYIDYRHAKSASVLYADGHIGMLTHTSASTLTQTDWKGR